MRGRKTKREGTEHRDSGSPLRIPSPSFFPAPLPRTPSASSFCTIDLGAESGRVMLGRFDGEKLSITEAYRFDSAPVLLPDGLHTDSLHIWTEMKRGMARASKEAGGDVAGIGIDSWGVDFGLLDRYGRLLGNPYHYRDRLTEGILDAAFDVMPREEIFRQTGLQFMPINTLFQLYALLLRGFPLDAASKLLMTPDLFNYWLCGRTLNEFTIATTSQCFDPRQGGWAWPVIERFGIPKELFGDIVMPGTVCGPLLPQVAAETGLEGVPVIAPGCHDTALAVAAVPAVGPGFAYISCGTWSLLGTEIESPCINRKSLAADFTNEGGVCGTFRFQKSLTGLWILQECRRQWRREGSDTSYDVLTEEASGAPALRSLIDPADPEFAKPGDMASRIAAFCERSGQPVPVGRGAIIRCVLESLALSYRRTLEELERILGRRLDPVHLVGGGTQNRLLCQFAANAMERTVIAGPVEATAIGNACMQAIALGHLSSLTEARALVRNSFETATYTPQERDRWQEAYGRFGREERGERKEERGKTG